MGPGPESLRPARAWPGRGPGRGLRAARPGLRTGKKKKKKARFIAPEAAALWRRPLSLGRDRAQAAGLGGRASGPGQPGRARLASSSSPLVRRPLGAPGLMPFLPHPLGTASPLCVSFSLPTRALKKVLGSRAGGAAEPGSAFRFPARGSRGPRLHCCDCVDRYYWVTVAPLPRSLGGADRGSVQGCECGGRTGRSPPVPASRAGPRRAPGPAPGGSAR